MISDNYVNIMIIYRPFDYYGISVSNSIPSILALIKDNYVFIYEKHQ